MAGWVPRLVTVTRFEIDLPDDVAERVSAAAAAEGVDAETLAGKTICESFPSRRKLSFVGLGRSTTGNRAADDEKLLAEGFGGERRRAGR